MSEFPERRIRLSGIHSPDPILPEDNTMGRVNEVDCPTILDIRSSRSAIHVWQVKKNQLAGSQVKVTVSDFGLST